MAQIELLQPTEKIKDSYGKINTSLTNLNNELGTTVKQSVVLNAGTPLGSVVTSGFYRLAGSHPDAPSGIGHGVLIVSRGADIVFQIVTGFAGSRFFMRHGNPPEAGGTGSYQPWREIWHDGNNAASLSANGYQRFASGKIMQHGRVTVTGNNAANPVTFPIVFPNDCDTVVGVLEGSAGEAVSIESITPSGFTARSAATSTTTLHYIAWGR